MVPIHFTVSMWNRKEHLRLFLANLCGIYRLDPQIVLHITAFAGEDATMDELRQMLWDLPFSSSFCYLREKFCNGRGHNIAASNVPGDDILCLPPVDLKMPMDITSRIRRYTAQGKEYFGPKVANADKYGQPHICEYAYSLISLYKSDFVAAGCHQENYCWGGDEKQFKGGEDMRLARRLKRRGLKEHRPICWDLVCRWHLRNIDQRFYSTLRRYRTKPWWTTVDSKGEPVQLLEAGAQQEGV